MAGAGFFQSLWEKADLGGRFGPIWDPINKIYLRTASMEWNVPGEVWAARRARFLLDTEGTGNVAFR